MIFIDAWIELGRRCTINQNDNRDFSLYPLYYVIEFINFEALESYLSTPKFTGNQFDLTEIPSIINFSIAAEAQDMKSYFISEIFEKTYFFGKPEMEFQNDENDNLGYEKKSAFFICRVLNKALECIPGQNEDNLLDLFTTDYRTNSQIDALYQPNIASLKIDELSNIFKQNLSFFVNAFQNSDYLLKGKDMRLLAWILYLKKENFKSLDKKLKYAQIIFNIVGVPEKTSPSLYKDYSAYHTSEQTEKMISEQQYVLSFIGYLKWDLELLLQQMDHNTPSYAIISSLFLLLNWNEVLHFIYKKNRLLLDQPLITVKHDYNNDIINEDNDIAKYYDDLKQLVDEQITPLVGCYSLLFQIAKAKMHGLKESLKSEEIKISLEENYKLSQLVQEMISNIHNQRLMEKINKNKQYEKPLEVLLRDMKSKFTALQLYQLQTKKTEEDNVVKADRVLDPFSFVIRDLFSLKDFYLTNFKKLMEKTNITAKFHWTHMNNYIIIAEHYYSVRFFNSALTGSNIKRVPDKIKEYLLILQNIARDCSNINTNDKIKNLSIFSKLIILLLEKLCENIPKNDQKKSREFIEKVLQLTSTISGYDFTKCFQDQCYKVDECNHCKHETLDHVALHISNTIEKMFADNTLFKLILPQNSREELFLELFPIMLGINSKDDTWMLPKISSDQDYTNNDLYLNLEDDNDNYRNITDELDSHSKNNDTIIKAKKQKNDENFSEMKLLNFKLFSRNVFKLIKMISIDLGQCINDDKMMIKYLKLIFENIESILNKSKPEEKKNEIKTDDYKKSSLSEFGKFISSVYKLKDGEIKDSRDLNVVVDYFIKDTDKERTNDIVSYICEINKNFDVKSFKSSIDIITKINKASIIDNVRSLFSKIKASQANEKDLFEICDQLDDGSDSISQKEFSILAKRLGTPLTEHRIQEIFSDIKGVNVSVDNMELNVLGIKAFAIGGGFGAVVNSLFPARKIYFINYNLFLLILVAGLALKGKDDDKEKLDHLNVEKACEKSKAVILAHK